ncbi:hypothetical protein TNCV_3307301 [Trichonephila clavipes]|nr:hypothetical protein TNCV_3307301 [Trichonephila clavipes]
MSSSLVPLKTHRVGQRCTLNLSRTETSSRWCGAIVKSGISRSDIILVIRLFKFTRSVAISPRVAEQCDVNIPLLTHSLLLVIIFSRRPSLNILSANLKHFCILSANLQAVLPKCLGGPPVDSDRDNADH